MFATLLLLNAWNLFGLWHWLTLGAGQKMVDMLIRIVMILLLSSVGWTLLAGAGALGVVVSFGSQTLVKDIITGVFIQFKNGMNTDDLATIGAITSTVERMSIRSVGVRQDTDTYHIIPWSSITTFANFVRGIGLVCRQLRC